jgi:enoyl-CoA hydratase
LGEEAERIGLVSLCVHGADLQSIALEIAVELAIGAQSAIRWTKYAPNNWLRVNRPLFDTSTALEMLGFIGAEARVQFLNQLRDKAGFNNRNQRRMGREP